MVSLGIQPIAHTTHHTSHMHKVLGITTSSFLRVDNDIKIGERTVKVRMDRARRMVASKEDSYKRVYADDGKSCTYPKIAENRLRVKGQLYFQNMDITGSKEGTEKEPKMALLPYHLEILFPRLEEMARELGEEGEEGVEIIPYYQMDGAGSRQCKKLLTMIDEEFNRRGWIFRFQPSQNPESNIKDSYVFPSLSHLVTIEKGQSNRSYSLKVENL